MNEALGRRIKATIFIDVCDDCGNDYVQIGLRDWRWERCDKCCIGSELYERRYWQRKGKRKSKTGRKSGWLILRAAEAVRNGVDKLPASR